MLDVDIWKKFTCAIYELSMIAAINEAFGEVNVKFDSLIMERWFVVILLGILEI
jgi:hypothetical protein